MKFYVNEIAETIDELTPLPWGEHYVGLFSQCETKVEGSFCGYYSCEKYLNTELLAYCVYKKCMYLGKKFGTVVKFNKQFSEIKIATHMFTKVIEANSIEEAIEKFEKCDYRSWTSETDEFEQANNISDNL